MPLCLVGAVAVAGGETSPTAQIDTLLPQPASDALDAELVGRDVCAASYSDGSRWLAAVPGGRWWLRRRTVRLLRAAAARCRRG